MIEYVMCEDKPGCICGDWMFRVLKRYADDSNDRAIAEFLDALPVDQVLRYQLLGVMDETIGYPSPARDRFMIRAEERFRTAFDQYKVDEMFAIKGRRNAICGDRPEQRDKRLWDERMAAERAARKTEGATAADIQRAADHVIKLVG